MESSRSGIGADTVADVEANAGEAVVDGVGNTEDVVEVAMAQI
jgi:hypothetical protein